MKVSIVCPYYNEAAIIEKAFDGMLDNLKNIKMDWELILVNDGSLDESYDIVLKKTNNDPRIKLISYPYNQGRGYALSQGIKAAQGDFIITTEIDLSWGDDIIQIILNEFERNPRLDVVVASPHLPGGGYKNVPYKRILLSKYGNILINLLFTKNITMNTGMTRGYKRDVIQGIPTYEKGKEFHLETLLKLVSLGYDIGEVPAILEWKDKRLTRVDTAPRKSSSKIIKLIFSHLNFAVFANPIRYFWGMGTIALLISIIFIIEAFYSLIIGRIAIYYALVGFLMFIISLFFFGFGILANQNNYILKELWRLQKKRNNSLD